MKRRLRQGAQLIVADPRRIDLVRTPHIEAAHHLQLAPGTNVALVNAMAHVVVTEGLADAGFVAERCEGFDEWAAFIARPEHSPEAVEEITGVPATELRAAARLYATAPNGAIYYGLGVTEHSQGSTMVMAMANLAMVTGNIGRRGVGVNPLRGQNNVQGSCDMGSFPHELPGYRHVSDDNVRDIFEHLWGVPILPEPGLRIPNMFDPAIDGTFRALYIQGEDIAQSDPNTQHVHAALAAMELVVVQDLFLNETAKFAHVFLPGTIVPREGRHVHQRRAPHQPRAPGDGAPHRQARVGDGVRRGPGDGLPDALRPPEPDHGRDRASPRRRSPASRSPTSTRSAACSGRATLLRRTARRSCTSTASSAARASSSRRSTSPPRSAAPAGSR